MDTSISILNLAAKCQLPRTIDGRTSIDLRAFKELYKAGLVEAINASAADGDCYLDPAITTAGRKYLSRTRPIIRNVMPYKMQRECAAPEKHVAGLLKFFSKSEYLDDFLRGRLYCNTPQYYRESPILGVSDDYEACIASFNRKKHGTPPNVVIDGVPLNLSQVEKLIVYGDADRYDAHLQCWFAVDRPIYFQPGMLALKSDLARVSSEFGPFSVFLPAGNLEAYGRLLDEAASDGFLGSHVQYTDNWHVRGMFRKRRAFSYQREYRFAIGCVEKGHLPHRVLQTPPLDHLVEVCPNLSVRNGREIISILPAQGSCVA